MNFFSKKRLYISIIRVVVSLFALLFFPLFSSQSEAKTSAIRIGYSLLTPIHCHIGEVFQRTNILKKYKLKAELSSFVKGRGQNMAIVEGRIDTAFSSGLPTILVLAESPHMRIVASPGALGRVAVLVPQSSHIITLADLLGKRLGVSKTSTAHKELLFWLHSVSLDPNRDIHIVDLSPEEMSSALSDQTVDAIATWDPWLELLLRKHRLRIICSKPFWSFLLISNDYINKYPDRVINYLSAVKEALLWASLHSKKTNYWVAQKSGWDLEVIEVVVRHNDNFSYIKRREDINLNLSAEQINSLQECVIFAKDLGLIPQDFALERYLDLNILKDAK